MKYTETKQIEPFDWRKALSKPAMRKHNIFDFEDMYKRSVDWVTCACGNQCAIIPRDPSGVPKDVLLQSLGMRFYKTINSIYNLMSFNRNKVEEMRVEALRMEAIQILDSIEKRSTELIKELT